MPAPSAPVQDLLATLAAGRVARLGMDEWTAMATAFPEMERHATGLAGDLVIVQVADGLAAVEAPTDPERAIRYLGDWDAVRRFVAERLAQYERMWEGCGCRIDYFG
ncbi:MAG: hypothetical protein OEY20_01835 [Gemmatimonadota bacterium]|nr:hypothetical protein [Gemmatimonadota bacterium]MDH4350282.1 hypothetical protein [Gemmatimonadota bacterium]MDH5195973.1 hypothetical protein [Gemmatimonadota bacterium]